MKSVLENLFLGLDKTGATGIESAAEKVKTPIAGDNRAKSSILQAQPPRQILKTRV
jgi:hypothetical protein